MKKFRLIIVSGIVILFFNYPILLADEKNYKIIKLVNDQVITNYDLEQRIKLHATLNNLNLNDGNIDKLADDLLLLMVEEKLQIEQMDKYKISISENKINDYIQRAYIGQENDINELIELLSNNNIDIKILRNLVQVRLGWNELAGRLYYRTSEINQDDLISAMQNDSSLSKDQAENNLLQKQIELRAKKLLRDLKAEANIETR
jgi:peptidyl-prolyl cis-trans isomerase SurA